MTLRSLLFLLMTLSLVACMEDSGDDGDDMDTDDNTATETETDVSEYFPKDISLASPFSESGSINAAPGAGLDSDTALVDGVLEGTTELDTVLDFQNFLGAAVNANCYGPSLMWANHPDDSNPASGELPGGDLMLWQSEDSQGNACAVAQLNQQLQQTSKQTLTALLLMAGTVQVASASSVDLPEASNSIDLTDEFNALSLSDTTFDSVTVEQNSDASWRYEMEFSYSGGSNDLDITITLDHNETEAESDSDSEESDDAFEGVLAYAISATNAEFGGGNCMDSNRTFNASLAYELEGDAVELQARSATFCGADAYGFVEDSTSDEFGQVDDDKIYDTDANGWSENFAIFVADYDIETLDGEYSYAWQAGRGDSHSRALNIAIDDTGSGTAFAGFANPIPSYDGVIKGMICNWAGPGNSHTPVLYAQQQVFSYNSTSGAYEVDSEKIDYLPTNSCSYDGSGTFTIDTDLDSDLSDETALTATSADLFGDGTSDLETLFSAAGVDLPEPIGGWPSESN